MTGGNILRMYDMLYCMQLNKKHSDFIANGTLKQPPPLHIRDKVHFIFSTSVSFLIFRRDFDLLPAFAAVLPPKEAFQRGRNAQRLHVPSGMHPKRRHLHAHVRRVRHAGAKRRGQVSSLNFIAKYRSCNTTQDVQGRKYEAHNGRAHVAAPPRCWHRIASSGMLKQRHAFVEAHAHL